MFDRVLSTLLIKVCQNSHSKTFLRTTGLKDFTKSSKKILSSDANSEPSQISKMIVLGEIGKRVKTLNYVYNNLHFRCLAWFLNMPLRMNSFFSEVASLMFAILLKAEYVVGCFLKNVENSRFVEHLSTIASIS